jgi:hypothetical protein
MENIMFTEMITALKENTIPKESSIKGRLNIALIKKEAILNLPKNFHVADPKINPRPDHMIWAAVLLKDKDLFDITTSIFLTEIDIQQTTAGTDQKDQAIRLEKILRELLSLPSENQIKNIINNSITAISAFNLLP